MCYLDYYSNEDLALISKATDNNYLSMSQNELFLALYKYLDMNYSSNLINILGYLLYVLSDDEKEVISYDIFYSDDIVDKRITLASIIYYMYINKETSKSKIQYRFYIGNNKTDEIYDKLTRLYILKGVSKSNKALNVSMTNALNIINN